MSFARVGLLLVLAPLWYVLYHILVGLCSLMNTYYWPPSDPEDDPPDDDGGWRKAA